MGVLSAGGILPHVHLGYLDVRDARWMLTFEVCTRRSLILAIVSVFCGGSVAAQMPQPPATILLIQHAEKLTDGRIDLSPVGFERAKVIPQLFGGTAAPHHLPRPDFLFATHLSAKSNRPVETITPL